QEEVAAFVQARLAAVRVEARATNRLAVQFAGCRKAGPDGVDVRAMAEPGSAQDWLARRGRGANEGRAPDCILGAVRGRAMATPRLSAVRANPPAGPGSRPPTRPPRSRRTEPIASRCVRACVPEPISARSPASFFASASVAAAEAAAVRIAVIAEASRIASG